MILLNVYIELGYDDTPIFTCLKSLLPSWIRHCRKSVVRPIYGILYAYRIWVEHSMR